MPSLIKQDGRYYLQFYNSRRQPKQKRVALGTGNRRVAEQLQSRLVAAFLLGEYDPWGEAYREITTLGEAFAAFMERKRNLRPNTQDNYRWIVGSFVRHAGVELPVESLTWHHIQRWLDSTDTNEQGRYSYWQRAGIFCRFLVGQGVLKSDPSKELGIVAPPHKLAGKVVTEHDLSKICSAAVELGLDYISDVSVVTFDLALRLTEVCSLKKSWIDFDGSWLTLIQDGRFVTKSGVELVKPVSARSMEILARACHDRDDEDCTFRNTRGNPLTPKWTSKAFKRVVRHVGLPESITFHGLRHGGITRLVVLGANIELARRLAGHRDLQTTMRYVHFSEKEGHETVRCLMNTPISVSRPT